jgi:hypothetical protein
MKLRDAVFGPIFVEAISRHPVSRFPTTVLPGSADAIFGITDSSQIDSRPWYTNRTTLDIAHHEPGNEVIRVEARLGHEVLVTSQIVDE